MAAGSPSESIRRLAQLKKAAAWMTSAIARSSSPARRRRSTCSGPNALGVAVSADEVKKLERPLADELGTAHAR